MKEKLFNVQTIRLFSAPAKQLFHAPFIRSLLPPLIALILSLIFWQGFQATDDLDYSTYAFSLLKGRQTPILNHHFLRIGMTIPLAILFHIFGVNEFSLTVLPLVCTVITAYLVVLLGTHFFDEKTGVLAGLLFALFPLTTYLSTFFIPEPILSFELCLSVILFLKSMKNDEAHPGLMKFIAGFIIGISYLTTEVGALMIPIIFLYQFCKKQVSKRDSFLLFGFLSVVISELLYYYVFYESAFYKFNVHSQDLAQDPMLHSANINLIKRLLMAYPRFFLLPNADFSLFGPIMIIGGIYGIFNFRKSGFLIIWSMAILVFYNFMSVRLDKYVALPVATRLLFPGCIPLLILSSKSLIEITKYLEKSVINPMLIYTTHILKYLIICVVIIFSLMMDSINNNTSLTSIIARNSENVAQFLSDKKSVNLITDLRTSNSISFYRQYRNEDGIFDYERGRQELENRNINNRVTTYLVINGVILNEKEITGSYYGETLSVPKNALGILKSYQVEYKKPVYESQYKKSIFYDYIINNKIISCILGKDKYNRIANIFKYKTSLTKIMVYRYQQEK